MQQQLTRLILCLTLLFTAACAAPPLFQSTSPSANELAQVELQIANAESAAPAGVAQNATIMGRDADGRATVLLRQGTNGWTCVPDWPASPVNDPQCNDAIWTAFMDAYAAGTDPVINEVGISYMLQGGSDPSATDPFAPIPTNAEDWVNSPAHLMLLSPDGFKFWKYPSAPNQVDPYIMWDDTPYEHLMVPVPPITAVQIPTMDDPVAQEVMQAEQELNYAADFLHDVFAADRFFADDYSGADANGSFNKTESLEGIKSGIYQGKLAEFTNVTVEVNGDTATADFIIYFTGTWDGNTVNRARAHYTNVWMKRDGEWQMVKSTAK